MKLKISYIHIFILSIITAFAIFLTKDSLLLSESSDTRVYFEFNRFKCYGEGFTKQYWNKPYEFFYDVLSIFYCADTYKNFVPVAFLYFFWTLFIFLAIFYKRFGFFETFIFIVIFFLAINPNHLVSQGRQMGSFFLFFAALLLNKKNNGISFILLLFSFLAHNNTFIFSFAIYIFMNLKKISEFIIIFSIRNKLLSAFLIFSVLVFILNSDFIIYLFRNGIYLFDAHSNLGFKDRLVSSFIKYLFFSQVFSFYFILVFNVKSNIINYIACYAYILFFIAIISIIYKLNTDMMIFRLLYPVKYVFIPICFVFAYKKMIGKKCSV